RARTRLTTARTPARTWRSTSAHARATAAASSNSPRFRRHLELAELGERDFLPRPGRMERRRGRFPSRSGPPTTMGAWFLVLFRGVIESYGATLRPPAWPSGKDPLAC